MFRRDHHLASTRPSHAWRGRALCKSQSERREWEVADEPPLWLTSSRHRAPWRQPWRMLTYPQTDWLMWCWYRVQLYYVWVVLCLKNKCLRRKCSKNHSKSQDCDQKEQNLALAFPLLLGPLPLSPVLAMWVCFHRDFWENKQTNTLPGWNKSISHHVITSFKTL